MEQRQRRDGNRPASPPSQRLAATATYALTFQGPATQWSTGARKPSATSGVNARISSSRSLMQVGNHTKDLRSVRRTVDRASTTTTRAQLVGSLTTPSCAMSGVSPADAPAKLYRVDHRCFRDSPPYQTLRSATCPGQSGRQMNLTMGNCSPTSSAGSGRTKPTRRQASQVRHPPSLIAFSGGPAVRRASPRFGSSELTRRSRQSCCGSATASFFASRCQHPGMGEAFGIRPGLCLGTAFRC